MNPGNTIVSILRETDPGLFLADEQGNEVCCLTIQTQATGNWAAT